MNILYYGLSTNQGGIETYLFKIARNIDRDSFNLFFIDETDGKACFRRELESLGATFFDITPRRKSILKNRRDLHALFVNNTFDVLHFNCNTLSYIEPVLIALDFGVKVVLHSRNSGSVLISTILHRLNYCRLEINRKKKLIQQVAVSDVAGRWMFGKHGNYQVLNNGVEIERFRFKKFKREKARSQLGVENKTVYGNVGAFLDAKNHLFLLDVFSFISAEDANAVLLLAGDGPLREMIESRIHTLGLSKKVYLLGIRKDIPELMMAMDCLVFPSTYEGFPNVILEAETTGLPIVMSDVITPEVAILDTCESLSLDLPLKIWKEKCIEAAHKVYSRETAADDIEMSGYSVRDEIIKVESIYKGRVR